MAGGGDTVDTAVDARVDDLGAMDTAFGVQVLFVSGLYELDDRLPAAARRAGGGGSIGGQPVSVEVKVTATHGHNIKPYTLHRRWKVTRGG